MLTRFHRIPFIALFCAMLFAFNPLPAPARSTILDYDARRLVSRADLHYPAPPSRIEEGLPIGNGVTGTLLWTTTSSLHMQINRVDVFSCNAATNSFPERHTDYCGGCGFVDIDLGGGALAGPDAPQHLSCYDGLVTIAGRGVKTRSLAWNARDVIATEITDTRPNSAPLRVRLRALRPPLVKSLDHTAVSRMQVCAPADNAGAWANLIVLTQHFSEGDYYCASAVAIWMSGPGVKGRFINDYDTELVAESGGGTRTVLVASAATFDRNQDVAKAALEHLEAAHKLTFAQIEEQTRAWWADFWSRSFVHLHSPDGVADDVEANYNYYLYVMASCSRGRYPAKFNGMLWTNTGDRRSWGAQFWGANQECLYQALLPANRPELLDPMFAMYSGMFDSLALAARQQWGSQGIFIPETVSFSGLAPLPDAIAREMQDLYLLKKPWSDASPEFKAYAANRPPHSSRWNWKSGGEWVAGKWVTGERGGGPYGPVTHIFSRGAKIAYLYWQRYEYTGDRDWLRERAWPMLRGVAEFYRNYPNLKKEADGLDHIYYVNSNEPLWGGRDTDEEIASMRAILPVAIRASEILGVDAEMRPLWRELHDHLPPPPTSDMAATTIPMSIVRYPTIPPRDGSESSSSRSRRPSSPAAGPTWIKGLAPIIQGRGASLPDANTTPMWILDLCTLEADPATLKLANATYDAWFPSGAAGRRLGVLSKLAAVAAALGRAADVKLLLPAQLRVTEGPALANRLTLKEGPGTTCNEHAGRVADALHLALCQSIPPAPGQDPVIRVFPALPSSWDADFTLLCRGGFLVTSSIRAGRIEFVEIHSQLGGPCRIRNPWGEQTRVMVHLNGEPPDHLAGSLLTFPTRPGKTYLLFPADAKAPTPRKIKLEN